MRRIQKSQKVTKLETEQYQVLVLLWVRGMGVNYRGKIDGNNNEGTTEIKVY